MEDFVTLKDEDYINLLLGEEDRRINEVHDVCRQANVTILRLLLEQCPEDHLLIFGNESFDGIKESMDDIIIAMKNGYQYDIRGIHIVNPMYYKNCQNPAVAIERDMIHRGGKTSYTIDIWKFIPDSEWR